MLRLRLPFAQLGEHVTRIIVACRLWEVFVHVLWLTTNHKIVWLTQATHMPHKVCRALEKARIPISIRPYVSLTSAIKTSHLRNRAQHSAKTYARTPTDPDGVCACVRYAHHSEHRILTLGSAGCDRAAGDSWTSWTLASVSGRFSSPAFSSRRASDS